MAETLATAQTTWTEGASSSVPVNSIGDTDRYSYSATSLATATSDGRYVFALPNLISGGSGTHNTFSFAFHGIASDSTSDIRARIWLASEIGTSDFQFGLYIGEVKLIIGTTNGPSSKKLISDILIVDDRSISPPSLRTVGTDPTKGVGMIAFDALGSERVILQLGTDKMGVEIYPDTRGF